VQKAASGTKTPVKKTAGKTTGTSTPAKKAQPQSQRDLDLAGLNLGEKEEAESADFEVPKVTIAREKLLEEVAATLASQQKDSPALSLVVIGTCVLLPTTVDAHRFAVQVTWMQVSRLLWDACSMSSAGWRRRKS
jgi:hypothetical protein